MTASAHEVADDGATVEPPAVQMGRFSENPSLAAARTRSRASVAFAAFLLAATAACGAGPPPPPPGASVDTSRARQVSVDGLPRTTELTRSRDLYPGQGEERGKPLFRVVDLLPIRGGGVVIANSGASQILAVDSSGALEWTAGRKGRGPREFRGLARLERWRGDTIIAIDNGNSAASFWTTSGEFVRTTTARPTAPEPEPHLLFTVPGSLVGVLGDGRLVIRGPERAYGTGEPGGRRVRTSITLVHAGGRREVPFHLPGPRVYELRRPARLPVTIAPMSGGTAVHVVSTGRGYDLAWARADAYEVVLLQADSHANRILRIRQSREPVTPSLRKGYLKTWSPWRGVKQKIPFPSRVPAFDQVFVAADGSLWARRFHWGDRPEEWVHFDPDEGAVARYRFPARVWILTATGARAYGVQRDDLDVEHIVRFDLPPESAGR